MTFDSSSSEQPRPASGGYLPSNAETFGTRSGEKKASFDAEPATVPVAPTVGDAYSHAWTVLKREFWRLLLIGCATFVGSSIIAVLAERLLGGWVGGIVQVAITTPMYYGAGFACLKAVRNERPRLGDILVPFTTNWLSCIVASLILWVILVVGYLLLIVPGVFLTVRLSCVAYLLVDERRGPIDALRESWRRTEGYFWTLLGGGLLAIVVVIVGFILLVVGSIPATMLVYLAFATLYAAITQEKESAAYAS